MKRYTEIYVEHDLDRYSVSRLVFVNDEDYCDYLNLEFPYIYDVNSKLIEFKRIKLNDQLFTCTIIKILKL